MFGLKESDIFQICSTLAIHNDVDEAILFGSRAKGTYKKGSDVDIALKGASINLSTVNSISFTLNEESLMPYKFDILNYQTIQNQELLHHIERVGICFYKKIP